MTEQKAETPHKIKDFNTIAHDTMIKRMAYQLIESNKSNQETITKTTCKIKQKLKAHKIEQNQFKKTQNKANKLAALAAMIRHSNNVVGC